MSARTREWVFLVGAAGLAILLLWGMGGLPSFGRAHQSLGLALLASAPAHRHALAVVTAVNFDYRGLDTLGEEFILFTAVAGVALLLRPSRVKPKQEGEDAAGETPSEENPPGPTLPEATEAVRAWGYGLAVFTFFFGLYIVLLAHLSLGGGFQGGTVLATAWLLVYLAGGDELFHRVSPAKAVDAADALGAGGYALIGFLALLTGAAFLQNVLPLGQTGSIASAGTIPVINAAVGVEVAAGFILLFHEFTKELEQPSTPDEARRSGGKT